MPGAAPGGRLGAWLQRGVVAAALMVLTAALLAGPLAWLGWWRPALVVPLLAVSALVALALVARLPVLPIGTGPAWGLIVVSLATGCWATATHSSQILPRRDAGSNLQAAIALADTGHRILQVPAASIGGPQILDIAGLTIASPAFYQVGDAAQPAVEPQFVIGPAAVYSLGRWVGGIEAMLILPGWLVAAGVLALGLLTTVVLRGWWGVVAALAVAIQFPVLHTGRATYSEPLAMLTLGAGLLLMVLAARRDHARAAALAGLLIGGTALVRIDGLREAILLLPVIALGALSGRAWARPLLLGTAVGLLGSFAAALALSREYLGSITGSLLPLVALGVATAGGALLVLVLARRGLRMPTTLARALPGGLALAVLGTGILLAARPLFLTVRQDARDPGARVVAGLQQRQGLPVDGGRTYAEHSVTWLAWWVGPVALAVALITLAVLFARVARAWTAGEGLPAWAGVLVVASGSTLLTLWRPGITPDHPWAERRLVIALPFVALLVTAGAAWLWRGGPEAWRMSTGARGAVAGRALACAAIVTLLLPSAAATWPHRLERVEAGSLLPVAQVCRALAPGDVAVAVDARAANEWPQVIRGMCDRPALSTTNALRNDPHALAAALDRVASGLPSGARLVLVSADSAAAITALGGTPQQVASSVVLEDERLLERRPDGVVPLPIEIWLAAYPP